MNLFKFKARTEEAPKSADPIDWDAFYGDFPKWTQITGALRDLDQRILALEGRGDEAKRRLSLFSAFVGRFKKDAA